MADPFSIATGVIGLAETGTSLASFLTEKYHSYRDAPAQILALAHEVEFVAGLVDIFASSLDNRETGSEKFVSDARNLIAQTREVFDEIYQLIPADRELADSHRARWRYMLDKKKLGEKEQRLRQLQQMFMFMDTVYRYRSSGSGSSSSGPGISSTNNANSNAISSGELQAGSFEGILQQIPVHINTSSAGNVEVEASSPVEFRATISLQPVNKPPEAIPYAAIEPIAEVQTRSSNVQRDVKKGCRQRLEQMRRSPFFSPELLDPPRIQMRAAVPYTASMKYNEVAEYKPESEDGDDESEDDKQQADRPDQRPTIMSKAEACEDVDDLLGKWFDEKSTMTTTTARGPKNARQAGHQPPHEQPPPTHDEDEEGVLASYPAAPVNDNGMPEYQVNGETPMHYNLGFAPLPSPPAVVPRSNGQRHTVRRTASSTSSSTYSSSQPMALDLDWRCKHCRRKQRGGRRFHCTKCPDFDLCSDCFDRRDVMSKHAHLKRSFVELKSLI